MEGIIDRVAGPVVHKDTAMAAVRGPDGKGGRSQTVNEISTFTAELVKLRNWSVAKWVKQVVMEVTVVYWNPPWHVLEGAAGLELMLVNAHRVKNLPRPQDWRVGRDVARAAGRVRLAAREFRAPSVIAQLRDFTRYRKRLIDGRAKETQRIQKRWRTRGSS